MNEANQYFRATLLARQTVERLQQQGLPADEAKRLVAAVINAEEFAVMKGHHAFDEARFIERLRELRNKFKTETRTQPWTGTFQ
jgi:hypothetical protein